jgi:hypothetical protein
MANFKNSRIIPIALVLIIIAVAIAAVVSLTRAVFFSGSSNQTSTAKVDDSQQSLVSTTAERSVRMTVRGAIVADESFHSYRIVISPNTRNLTTFNGYLDTQVDQVALGNNIPAYEEFVHALSNANLAKGTELTGDKNDIRGICATGLVYQFDIINADKIVKNLWTSTCKGSSGSLDASVTQLRSLFTVQIPDAQTLIRKVSL